MREAAEDAETEQFDPQIDAASATTGNVFVGIGASPGLTICICSCCPASREDQE